MAIRNRCRLAIRLRVIRRAIRRCRAILNRAAIRPRPGTLKPGISGRWTHAGRLSPSGLSAAPDADAAATDAASPTAVRSRAAAATRLSARPTRPAARGHAFWKSNAARRAAARPVAPAAGRPAPVQAGLTEQQQLLQQLLDQPGGAPVAAGRPPQAPAPQRPAACEGRARIAVDGSAAAGKVTTALAR